MHLRNGEHGYGVVTKALHWLTVLAIVGQFAIGWTMDADAGADRADDRVDAFEERGEERAEQQGEAAEERFEAEVERQEEAASAETLGDIFAGGVFGDGVSGLEAHVLVGLLVLVAGLVRLGWRRTTSLPPWAEHLGDGERKLESTLEKAMLTLLIVVPVTGLLLLLAGADLLLLHVVAQIALIVVVAVHVGLVLKHTVLRRHRHLARML